MNRAQLINYLDQAIFVLIAAAAIALPLFFLPITSEFYETNKFTVFLIITVLGYLAWSTKMLVVQQFVFTRTPLNIPILIFAVVFFISTLTSIDPFHSFAGAGGKPWPGLFSLAVIAAFFFLAVSNLKTTRQIQIILWALIISVALASIVAIFSYFGYFLPGDFAKIRSFNPAGIINRLAVLQALVIPIAAASVIFTHNKFERFLAVVVSAVISFSFVLINFQISYVGVVIGILILLAGVTKTKLERDQIGGAAILTVFILIALLVRFVPAINKNLLFEWISQKDRSLGIAEQIDTPKETSLAPRAAWEIAAKSIGQRPFAGTGPGTYQFVYTQLKPRYLNTTSNWGIRFDKSNSDFTEFAATIGILGILAYLLVIVALARLIWILLAKGSNFSSYLPLAAALTGAIVNSFLTVSAFTNFATFFLLVAVISVLAKVNNEEQVFDITVELTALKNKFPFLALTNRGDSPTSQVERESFKSEVLPVIFTIFILILSYFALTYQIAAYRADYHFRQAVLASTTNDGSRTFNELQRAIQINPRVDRYHQFFSQIALSAGLNLARSGNVTDEQQQILAQLTQLAIDQGKIASGYQILPLRVPGISQANATNWETLSNVYAALIGSLQGADVHSINTLSQAVALDPENPVLHAKLGQLYQRLGSADLAQRKFEDANVVKFDFGPAHYYLAKVLIEKKADSKRIVDELNLAKRFLPSGDPALGDIESNLQNYQKQLQEQGEAQSQQQLPTPSPATPGATPGFSR